MKNPVPLFLTAVACAFLLLNTARAAHGERTIAEIFTPQGAGSSLVLELEVSDEFVYAKEGKKLTITAKVTGTPKLSLVQVDENGNRLRFLGVMTDRGAIPGAAEAGSQPGTVTTHSYFRKIQIQEREPGRLHFVVVNDLELESFRPAARPEVVVEVLERPSFLQVLKGIWKKFRVSE